ncbi:hypothetical protein [Wolbachia endosymbiont of Ctenocephalides felis wCfeJ]|uniref:hypothetical protein n=1 Tax=Wolbachia endosymbiont of Ctenocephalides felis wCfeJ TaxID=2732594 RepID=UPI0014457322|nr:hypothetical protein [Wolbachia endosymbiont of Ctenocephalides felis wCfeJ]
MLATKPYFHFYAKSKIRGVIFIYANKVKAYFHFYTESKIRGFFILIKGCHSSA